MGQMPRGGPRRSTASSESHGGCSASVGDRYRQTAEEVVADAGIHAAGRLSGTGQCWTCPLEGPARGLISTHERVRTQGVSLQRASSGDKKDGGQRREAGVLSVAVPVPVPVMRRAVVKRALLLGAAR
jgi:hypothetical protein